MSTRKYNKKGGKQEKIREVKQLVRAARLNLNIKEKEVVCKSNHYTENKGSFGKSKLRSCVGQIFL